MARRTARARFVRPPARTTMWIGSGVGITTVPESTKVLVSTLSSGSLLLRPFTILRTRMLIQWSSDQVAATETPEGDYAKMVVTDTAAAIGVTAVPDPSSVDGDPEADWFLFQSLISRVAFSSAVGVTRMGWQYTVDSKAMRKVGPDDDIVAVVSETGAVAARLITRGRMLIQLH